MTADISNRQLSEAVCATIKDGVYPEDEAIISSELSSGALKELSQMLEQAREEVKTSIRELSRLNAKDVDEWILEAKQLREDLEASKRETVDMETLAAQQQKLEATSIDASHKVQFLQRELAFNDQLTSTLENISEVRNAIDVAKEALVNKDIYKTMTIISEVEAQLKALEGCQRTGLLNLLRSKTTEIRESLARAAIFSWQKLIPVNYDTYEIRVRERYEADPKTGLENAVAVLDSLDLLKGRLLQLRKDAEALIFRPRMGKPTRHVQRSLQIHGPLIATIDQRPNSNIEDLLADISAGFNYFSLIMPTNLAAQFLPLLIPSVVAALIAGPLASSVPPDLSGITAFAHTLSIVRNFADTMGQRKWPGGGELIQWVEKAPIVWLQNRSNTTLSSIRQLLGRGVGKPRSVERVETQQVPAEEHIFQGNGEPDDWNASWSDDEDGKDGKDNREALEKPVIEDDEDAGAWGFDEDEEKPNETAKIKTPPQKDDEEAEDWGWGDENEHDSAPSGSTRGTTDIGPEPKSTNKKQAAETREVTLRESYFITAVPEQVIEIIVQAVDDADNLISSPAETYGSIKAAGEGLYALPRLILSMYRACAPNAYMSDASGNMFLYNDSLYLAEQLKAFAEHHAGKTDSRVLGLDADITALETFGKTGYGREMEAQRTILRDLLDGAQGFAHCTEAPFAESCELAISSVTERLTQLHAQWTAVLAPSALQQSLGSLLATITNKMIVDVEELTDISATESERLVLFCQRIEQLERLFLPSEERDPSANDVENASAEDEEKLAARAAMAASVYTPGLLKFQWLSQILEGALADIKFWWTESELALAFTSEEVVDLIEALFADSDHRRKAIAEIRKGR